MRKHRKYYPKLLLKNMKIPFYQTQWLGINLMKLADEMGHDISQIPGPLFYKSIYKKVLANNEFCLDQSWVDKKLYLSNWIGMFLNNLGVENANILSVGCGFGIVEVPLLQKGMQIDLQECQTDSIQYFKKKYPDIFEKTLFIFSEDLSSIQSNSYDIVISITSTYCLNQETLLNFLRSVKRILKKKGIFIWYETVLCLEDIICYLKSLVYSIIARDKIHKNSIFWGWKRSLHSQSVLAQQVGLSLRETVFFDKNNSIIFPSKIISLPYGSCVSWQTGIYCLQDT